jgi:hypothetical protein
VHAEDGFIVAALLEASSGADHASRSALQRDIALLTPDAGRFRVADHYTMRWAATACPVARPQRRDMAQARAGRSGRAVALFATAGTGRALAGIGLGLASGSGDA